jgi:hypothetical protein
LIHGPISVNKGEEIEFERAKSSGAKLIRIAADRVPLGEAAFCALPNVFWVRRLKIRKSCELRVASI